MWETGGPVFPLKKVLVAGRACDRKPKPCNKNADQKLSAVATPNWEKLKGNNIGAKYCKLYGIS